MESEEPDSQRLNIIRVHYDESYDEDVSVSNLHDESGSGQNVDCLVSKGKYYKQTYRRAWESMPDFKGKT